MFRERLSTSSKRVIVAFLLGAHALSFFDLLSSDRFVKIGLATEILTPFTALILILYLRFNQEKMRVPVPDFLVLLYILVNLLSGFAYLLPNHPADPQAFLLGFHYILSPALFYFCGRSLTPDDRTFVLRAICLANLFAFLVGLALYATHPGFYSSYLSRILASQGATEGWQLYGRLQGYMGSTAIGNLSWLTCFLALQANFSTSLTSIIVFISLVAGTLSQQRSAMVLVVAASMYAFLQLSRRPGAAKGFLSLAVMVLLLPLYIFYLDVSRTSAGFTSITSRTIARVTDDLVLGSPLEERIGSYQLALAIVRDFPFGLGMGAATSPAASSGYISGFEVHDANFARIFADTGILGLLIFFSIILWHACRLSQGPGGRWIFFLVCSFYCLQAIGTNTFDSFYVAHLFWIVLACATPAKGGIQFARENFSPSLRITNLPET